MGSKYREAEDGEWIRPVHAGYRLQCCDCGLVHVVDFRVVDGAIEVRLRRDKRATAQVRRRAGLTDAVLRALANVFP